jgi:hypothetical protein
VTPLRARLEREGATPLLLRGFEYWDGLRDGRAMPARADIDPAAIKPLLPHIALMDVLRNADPTWPLDFRYRLIGTQVDAMMNGRYTGLRMSSLPHQRPPAKIWTSLQRVSEGGEPTVNRVPYIDPHKDYLSVVDMVMPLAADGRNVDMLFCLIEFIPRRP